MEKGLGTVSGKRDAKEPQARDRPTKAVPPEFEEWHPSHIKTGLKNRRIGKKVPVQIPKKPWAAFIAPQSPGRSQFSAGAMRQL
jgi:hypothetical protein